ncbi:MAG: proline racemase family protein [Actinomycetota bacterium]
MQSIRVIHTVSCHAAGEVGDVVVGGVAPPPGATLAEQSRWLLDDGELRDLLLNEPRGGVFRHVNLLVPPRDPSADVGFLIMEPCHHPPMSGSNAMCVATVVLETGIVAMTEPETALTLEAPGGPVPVRARCVDGAVEAVTLTNLASFADRLDAALELEGHGTIRVDTAFGGDSFVLVDAADLGVDVDPTAAADLAALGARITAAANEQLGFTHPDPDLAWDNVSFCQIAGPLETVDGVPTMRSTTVIDPGKLDRSPTGTGVSARMAVLAARGVLDVGGSMVMRSIIDSTFEGRVAAATTVAGRQAIVPEITGTAWITGTHQHLLDPDDPWPRGYRVGDTWPGG